MPAALAAAIERLLADPACAATLGGARGTGAVPICGVDQMVDQHIRIYSDLLETRCAG